MPRLRRFLRPSRTPVDSVVDEVMARLAKTPAEADLDSVVDAGRVVAGEHIEVHSRPQPRGRYGMCTRSHRGHVIYVDPELPGDLREQTVLHELGHILLGHNDDAAPDRRDRLTALLTGESELEHTCVVPHLREWVQREDDAERFAATILRRLRRGMATQRLSRLDEAFG